MTTWHVTVTSILLGDSLGTCDEARDHVRELYIKEPRAASTDNREGPEGDPQAPGALSLTGCKGLNCANGLASWPRNPSLVEPSGESSALNNT